MIQGKKQLSSSDSLASIANKVVPTATQDFSQVYESLYKTVQNNSKTKFTPLFDFSKHKKQVDRKIKIITKYLESDQMLKNELVHLPCLTPSVREVSTKQRQKSKSTKIQVQKFALNNQTIYIHQKLSSPNCKDDKDNDSQTEKLLKKPFRSILSEKNKKLIYLSKRNVIEKVQLQQTDRKKYCNSEMKKKSVNLNPEQTSMELRKSKLIEIILQVDEKNTKGKKQFAQLQTFNKSVLNFPLMHQEMIGNVKPLEIESSPTKQKKYKLKSLEKTYALKEQFKTKNPFGIKKINWKSVLFPLTKVSKVSVNKILLRYLRIQHVIPPAMGFYKFYLGEGNNAQVIRQALKNKGYWIEVQSLNQKPNFVWTQLPFEQFYLQETKIQASEKTEKRVQSLVNLRENQINSFLRYHHNDYIKACEKLLPKNVFEQYLGEVVEKFKKGVKLNSFEEIDKCSKPYANEIKVKRLNNATSIRVQSQNQKDQKQGFRSIDFKLQNHIKNSKIIGNKKSLFNLFLQHCQSNNQNLNQFIPSTVHVILGQKFDQQSVLFLIEDQLQQGPWLIKPGEDTNRGHGIKIMQTHDELMREIKRRNDEFLQKQENSSSKILKQQTLIVQKYIEPFLYEGRKFDIRMWVIWAKNQLWWYKEGYLRTSSKQFCLKNSSRFVHLTNDAVQINNEDYGKYQPANKLSFAQFQRYLQKECVKGETVGKNSFSYIYEQMRQLTIKLFSICRKQLFENTLNFELFGLDFLVGKDMKVWLIECNTNPSLEVHCSLQSRLIPNLIENLLNIVIDPLFPCPQKRVSKEQLNAFWNQEAFKCEILIDGDQEE